MSVVSVAISKKWHRVQLHIKSAFLNSELNEDIYLKPAKGYKNTENKTWRLHKALYGLKQASRSWYECLRSFMVSLDFEEGKINPSIFVQKCGDRITVALIYVDDI